MQPDLLALAARGRKPDLTSKIGQRYGRLTIVSRAENKRRGAPRWVCVCDCGSVKTIDFCSISRGITVSCGCFCREKRASMQKHGAARRGHETSLHMVWTAMKQRCLNPSDKNYRHYGGRGIGVCKEWADDFSKFQADVGPKPDNGYSIDRIDNTMGYEPGNVRWATRSEQMRNTRGCRAVIRGDGKHYNTIVEAAEDVGVHPTGISAVCRGKQSRAGGHTWSYAALRAKAAQHMEADRG